MYWNRKLPCTTYYGNRPWRQSRITPIKAPRAWLRLHPLFQCTLLGQRWRIGVQDVQHPWMERLHHAQCISRDCFIVLPRSTRLVPTNIGLKACMTKICMHKFEKLV